MCQVMRLEVVPDRLDVVEFRRILGQPLDGEPVCAAGKRRHRELARVDRAIVLHENHRLGGLAGPGTKEPIELLEMGDEIAAALGRTGVDDELARDVIERPQHPPLPMRGRDRDASTPRSRPTVINNPPSSGPMFATATWGSNSSNTGLQEPPGRISPPRRPIASGMQREHHEVTIREAVLLQDRADHPAGPTSIRCGAFRFPRT